MNARAPNDPKTSRDGTGSDMPNAGTREDRLLRITAAICDGTPVDWNAERARSPDLRQLIRCLETLERIRNASRT